MNVPVVPSLPIIGHSIPFQRDALNFTAGMQKKYGDVFQILLLNQDFIVLLNPEITREIFLDKDDNYSSKEGWAVTLGPTFENGLMLRDFDDHKYHRTLLQDSFRHEAIHNYLSIIQPIIDNWIQHQNIYYDQIIDNTESLTKNSFIGLKSNQSYCWRVRYRDKSLKWSEWSNPTNFNTNNNPIQLKISPNPIIDESIVSIPFFTSSVVKIFNVEGKIMKIFNNPNNAIIKLNRLDFNPGIYILKVFSDNINHLQMKFTVL